MKIDTIKISQCGNNLITLSEELNTITESLYTRIINMPTKTGEWIGASAQEYAKNVYSDKEDVDAVKNEIRDLGNQLVENANRYEKAAKKDS